MPTLHLICGLPGSGKSTLAKELEEEHPALRHVKESDLDKRIVQCEAPTPDEIDFVETPR